MIVLSAALAVLMAAASAAAATETPAVIIEAPDSPVKISRASVLTVPGDPPVLLYAATNQTENDLEQFTITVYMFDAKGILKTEQIAPGRRTLAAKSTKYSSMVIDGDTIDPAGSILVGVNMAQRVNSDAWWRAELRATAEAAVPKKKP